MLRLSIILNCNCFIILKTRGISSKTIIQKQLRTIDLNAYYVNVQFTFIVIFDENKN